MCSINCYKGLKEYNTVHECSRCLYYCIACLMDNVLHVMLEHSSNCDTVRSSSVINLPRQALFLISSVPVGIILLYNRHKIVKLSTFLHIVMTEAI